MAILRSITMKPQGKKRSPHANTEKSEQRKASSKELDKQPEQTKEILSDIQVLESLKKGIYGPLNNPAILETIEPSLTNKESGGNIVAAANSENADRMMNMMDQKFSKFEDIITQIATSMGELRGEVNTMKGKLADAKLL